MPGSTNVSVPFYRGIAGKAMGALALVVVVVSLVSGYYSLKGARTLLTEQLSERGLVLARSLAFNSAYGVYTEDTVTLIRLLEGVMAEPDALFAVVTDAQGKELARRLRGSQIELGDILTDLPTDNVETVDSLRGEREGVLLLSAPVSTTEFVVADQEESFLIEFLDQGFSSDERLEVAREERQVFRGKVHIGLSSADIEHGMGEVSGKVTMVTLLMIVAGIAGSGLLVRVLTRPLHGMAQVAAQVGRGDLTAKVEVKGRDEVSLLGWAFNRMIDALSERDAEIKKTQEGLAKANRELGDLNAHLEERVNERTLQLQEQSAALEATNRELVESTERKSKFMANLAHELRTPLNSVVGFSEALRDGLLGELTEKQLKYVNNIVTGGRHILEMSSGILDLSKIEAGTVQLRAEPLDAVQHMEEIVTITEPQLGSKTLSVDIETADLDLTRQYLVDRSKFKQVLYNLMSNAIKFSPDKGRITLRCATVNDHLELRVSDTGAGVPEADREGIFEEFTQLSAGERVGGSGLGLSITRKLVELHGGRMWVEETDGGGATFVVRLPETPPSGPGVMLMN